MKRYSLLWDIGDNKAIPIYPNRKGTKTFTSIDAAKRRAMLLPKAYGQTTQAIIMEIDPDGNETPILTVQI